MRRITALAAAAMLGVTAPAAARVQPRGYEATLSATLERSWSWQDTTTCNAGTGAGRRVVALRTPRAVRVGPTGATVPVAGTLRLSGRAVTYEEGQDGSCVAREVACAATRVAIAGTVRVTMRGDTVRLTDLRYRTRGRAGCAPDVAAVRSALPGQPSLDSIVVRDRERKLRDRRIPRVTVRASSNPSAELSGGVTGRVEATVRWTLALARR